MQFEFFEKLCRESWDDWKHSANLERVLHPRSRKLRDIVQAIPGMASENKLMLLNNAVACLAQDEVYVEVGCWQGLTLVGAMTGNDSTRAFACDNFSQFGGPKNALAQNLSKYLPKDSVRFFDMDYRDFFAAAPWLPRKIGVYFYDGGHRFAEQYHAIELALPYLADQALIIVDDTNNPAVRRANHWLVHRLGSLQRIASLRTPWNGHASWWNGIEVFLYRGSASSKPPRRGLWLGVETFFWDRCVQSANVLESRIKQAALTVPFISRAAKKLKAS